MPSNSPGMPEGDDGLDGAGDLARQGAAVGVAEDDPAGTL
jgi:hypothetical protein